MKGEFGNPGTRQPMAKNEIEDSRKNKYAYFPDEAKKSRRKVIECPHEDSADEHEPSEDAKYVEKEIKRRLR